MNLLSSLQNVARGLMLSKGVRSHKEAQQRRQRLIGCAFDNALLLASPCGTGAESASTCKPDDAYTIDDARLAVKASHFQCGPTARAAEAWLIAARVEGVRFYSLKGHFVVLDEATLRIHDLEVPFGCMAREELPIWRRAQELQELDTRGLKNDAAYAAIFERYAEEWLRRRTRGSRPQRIGR